MLTDEHIKEMVVPKLQKLLLAGRRVQYRDGSTVVLANESGITIGYDSDIDGWNEYWLTASHLKLWDSSPQTVDELLAWFTVTLSVDEMLKLLPADK